MGMDATALGFFHESLFMADVSTRFYGREMCELGDQTLQLKGREKDPDRERTLAKVYFDRLGFNHTSIDIKGKRGSIPLDLSKPITDKRYLNRFDILTNFGTSEHVSNQFECWRNIHNLVKSGGVFIHMVPLTLDEGNKKEITGKHCDYCYMPKFFIKLANSNFYKFYYGELFVSHGSAGYCFRKYHTNKFQSTKEEIDSWVTT